MLKDEIVNNILINMIPFLKDNEISLLKNSIFKSLDEVEIIKKTTEISMFPNKNNKLLELFAISKKVEQLADSTIYQYVRSTEKFLLFINKNVENITSDDIRVYLAFLMKRTKNSEVSLNNTRKFIKSFFSWCVEEEHINRNPFDRIKNIKTKEKIKEILNRNEIEQLRNESKDVRDRAIIEFLLSTGVRVSECVGVNINHINWKTKEVQIYAKKTKNFRIVYLSDRALRSIYDYLLKRNINVANSREPLFPGSSGGQQIKEHNIEKIIKNIAIRARIEKKCTVHTFRRTLVSLLHGAGMQLEKIAIILGHKSSNTTEKYYLVLNNQNIRKNYYKCISISSL